MAGGGLGLSRTVTALKPLASGRRGQGATPTPPKTIHVDAYNSRKMSCLCVHPYAAHDGKLFLFYRTSQLNTHIAKRMF